MSSRGFLKFNAFSSQNSDVTEHSKNPRIPFHRISSEPRKQKTSLSRIWSFLYPQDSRVSGRWVPRWGPQSGNVTLGSLYCFLCSELKRAALNSDVNVGAASVRSLLPTPFPPLPTSQGLETSFWHVIHRTSPPLL